MVKAHYIILYYIKLYYILEHYFILYSFYSVVYCNLLFVLWCSAV